ncbi:MAG: RnfABCDGE type electron transport complex subunit D [Vicinamibacterales bacterium]
MTPPLVVTASPHLKAPASTPVIMWTVVASLLPIVAAAFFFFGISALLLIAASLLGCLAAEAAFGPRHTLLDGSAMITGILLGLALPASLPLWMAFIGGVVSIALGKRIFGGLGYNIFNPALLGRAFMMAAFPLPLTTWPAPVASVWRLAGDNFALPLMSADPALMTTAATPLGLAKFEQTHTAALPLFLGTTGGSLGETSAVVILVCGAYLAWRGFLNWRTPVSIFASVALLSGVIHLVDAKYPGPLFMLFSGGLVLGAVYMATDMVTSPTTNRGRWIFGAGVGALVVVIRLWGGLPEAVMYAILLMNALVPYINRSTQPRVFGTPGRALVGRGTGVAA